MNFPLSRVFSGKKACQEAYSDRNLFFQDVSVVEETSTSGYDEENPALLGTSTLGYPDGNLQGGQERVCDDKYGTDGVLPFQPSKEVGFSYSPATSKRALRTQRIKGHVIKPLSSLESCLMAQLYKEHAEIEDYVFSSVHSPLVPSTRPFLVTDGSIISRASGDSFSLPSTVIEKQTQTNTYSRQEAIHGIPQLPKVGYMNFRRTAPNQVERSRAVSCRIQNGRLQKLKGLSRGALILCLGISVGIMSSLLANKQEVEKLNNLLKQTENLVQDLQEELEMKDSLTVEELAVEDYESQDTHDEYFEGGHACSPEHKLDNSMEKYHSKCLEEERKEKSLSEIEAELEAELERLELTMNASSLEGKFDGVVELDPDFLPDVAVGELRADLFGRQAGDEHYTDRDGSGFSSIHSANYAVSPRELSLKLHEVIQSRLEDRVNELETALRNSKRKVQYMEYEHINNSSRNLSSSEPGSSIRGSPVNKNARPSADLPVVINLSGEALDPYNETYDLYTKVNSSEEDRPSGIKNSSHREGLHPCDQSPCQVQNGWMSNLTSKNQNDEAQTTLLIDFGSSRDDSDDSDDVMEKLLIKHIVEKAKKGSSVVLNAQKALFLNDDSEH